MSGQISSRCSIQLLHQVAHLQRVILCFEVAAVQQAVALCTLLPANIECRGKLVHAIRSNYCITLHIYKVLSSNQTCVMLVK